MSAYCLDTSAYARFKAGEPQVVEAIDTARWIGVPWVVLGELLGGFRVGDRTQRNEPELFEFLADPATEVLNADLTVAEKYADIYSHLRRTGRPIPTNDMWVAATAAATGSTVLTFDKHFEALRQLGPVILET